MPEAPTHIAYGALGTEGARLKAEGQGPATGSQMKSIISAPIKTKARFNENTERIMNLFSSDFLVVLNFQKSTIVFVGISTSRLCNNHVI